MGLVYATFELINTDDLALERRNLIGGDQVKRMNINMLVDSGAYMLAINENIQEYMQFPVIGKRKSVLADRTVVEHVLVGSVRIIFQNRISTCNAIVLPEDSEPLMGSIPMEEMDVLIHPQRDELIINPAHPDMAVLSLKKSA
jgi:clan AA aspartic protease